MVRVSKSRTTQVRAISFITAPGLNKSSAFMFRSLSDGTRKKKKRKVQPLTDQCFRKFFFILAAPASNKDKWWTVQTLREGSYTNLSNYNGVDVHIFRYQNPFRLEREINLTKWMDENRDVFRDILRFAQVYLAVNIGTTQFLEATWIARPLKLCSRWMTLLTRRCARPIFIILPFLSVEWPRMATIYWWENRAH